MGNLLNIQQEFFKTSCRNLVAVSHDEVPLHQTVAVGCAEGNEQIVGGG